jgi:NAD(P)-dependent dehydrogenase (short-subunit alcohol dehydrogenase family)
LTEHPPEIGYGLRGKAVWVTGASRGLGRRVAAALVEQGAKVALTARGADALADVAEELGGRAKSVVAFPGSVSSAKDVEACVERIVAEFGTLDVLVNNAGISPAYVSASELDEADWRRTIDVNLTGAFLCSRSAGRVMTRNGTGAIVNVSSIYGQVGGERLVAYAASKGGLDALTRTLALEWASHGVRVNAVAPGYLRTDLTRTLLDHDRLGPELLRRIPLNRVGRPDDVVPAILHLASPLSAYTTGATLVVDGGWTAQ